MRMIVPIGLLFIAGCSTPMFTMPPGPEAYRVGYKDGCDAGYANAGSPFYPISDVTQPPTANEPYASGWRGGFQVCRDSMQHMQRSISVLLGPP